MNINEFLTGVSINNELLLLSLLTLPIKAIALWYSARLDQKWWFGILFITNSFAILDFIYIFAVARKYQVETVKK